MSLLAVPVIEHSAVPSMTNSPTRSSRVARLPVGSAASSVSFLSRLQEATLGAPHGAAVVLGVVGGASSKRAAPISGWVPRHQLDARVGLRLH